MIHLSNIDYHTYIYQKYLFREEAMTKGYKYNVSCSETTSKNWTQSAIDCYQLGCSCSKCNLYKIYFYPSNIRCRMKETVIELVRRLGIPKEDT